MKRFVHPNVTVKRSPTGLGLFATGPIQKGEMVAEYWGRVVTEAEAQRIGGKYLFELENDMAIDGKTRKNIARYINHSCKPNCEPDEDVKGRRMFIKARRNIREGEELAYSYGKDYWESYIKPLKCKCGCGGKGPGRW